MIIERDIMQVQWTCPKCEKENILSVPVWEDINGEYLAIECPDCLGVEYVSLDVPK
jgi:ribosomal protein S27E